MVDTSIAAASLQYANTASTPDYQDTVIADGATLTVTNGLFVGTATDAGEGVCCVVDLTERHPLAQSTVSHHLRILVDARLVQQERRGTHSLYRVDIVTWQSFRDHLAALEPCCRETRDNVALRLQEP